MVAACCNTDAEGLDNYATRSVAVVVANRVVDQAANSSIRGGQTSSNVPHIGQADQTDHLMMEIFRGRWIPVQCYVRYLDHEAVNTARADMLARWALCDTALAQHLMTASMDLDDVDRLWPVRCVKCSPLLKHSAVRYLRVMFGYHICTCRALPAGHAVSVRLLYALLSSAFVFMFFYLFLALFALFSLFVHLMHWLRFNGRTDRPIVLRCNKRMDRPIVLHCNGRTDPPIVLRCNGQTDRPIMLRCNGRTDRPIVLRCNGRMDRPNVLHCNGRTNPPVVLPALDERTDQSCYAAMNEWTDQSCCAAMDERTHPSCCATMDEWTDQSCCAAMDECTDQSCCAAMDEWTDQSSR